VLTGAEVKSIRAGQVNLKESYVKEKRRELYLTGCHISPYEFARREETDATRDRKLLMHKHEIETLSGKMQQKGLTLVPLRLYFRKGRCKLEIGLGRGKKLHDKRQDMRAKEADRDIERAFRAHQKVN
jgi:SsrA-binding protein